MTQECCPKINPEDWNYKKHEWNNKSFYTKKHFRLGHFPVGVGTAIKKGLEEIKVQDLELDSPAMILLDETGPFTARELFAIKGNPNDKKVITLENKILYSKAYHGPFKEIPKQIEKLKNYVEKKEKNIERLYIWTTDCPGYWKERNGPTIVIFAQVKPNIL